MRELTTSDGFNNKEEIIGFDGDNNGHELKLFSFASVLAATDNFSTENKLGQGGFGPVFKVRFSHWIIYFILAKHKSGLISLLAYY